MGPEGVGSSPIVHLSSLVAAFFFLNYNYGVGQSILCLRYFNLRWEI